MNERSPDGVTGRLTVLTEEKCRAIYDAALTVIAVVGMTVPHETGAGCFSTRARPSRARTWCASPASSSTGRATRPRR